MDIKNYARGGQKYHAHRIDIARELLDAELSTVEPLSQFNRDRLFKLDAAKWNLFAFGERDWDICSRLRSSRSETLEANLLQLTLDYITANLTSVRSLYALERTISARILARHTPELVPVTDKLTATELRSLFAIRIECALRQTSADTIRDRLNEVFTSGWCRVRLLYPLVYHFVNRTPSAGLDAFLSYVVTGREHPSETEAIKLILSDEAARTENLAFKLYVGLMGHPFDACDFALDHIEYLIGADRALPRHIVQFLRDASALLPGTRASRLHDLCQPGTLALATGVSTTGLSSWLDLPEDELAVYAQFANVAAFTPPAKGDELDELRPMAVLSRMRSEEYPIPADFSRIVAERFGWSFTDGGRFLGALLRSIYMVERTARDLEVRDALRLVAHLGHVDPFVASAPSAMHALRVLARRGRGVAADPAAVEAKAERDLEARRPLADRLWINDLQWRLRRLEEQGRIGEWLSVVRDQVRLRPTFLTGINWEWVEEIVELERLDPFVNFAGAYLFLLMEGETSSFDPLRLRFTLEPLLRGLDVDAIVKTFIREYPNTAPAIVRRYLTTENLLASGLASNYVAALDMRVRALEACIQARNFGPLLTKQDYENEERALTSELLLTNVNTGKFEIPWETFRKDAEEKQRHLFAAVNSLRPRESDDAALSAIVETPFTFPNGRNQVYRYRLSQAPIFSLVTALLGDFMEHPAFGIEVILSGRFRHSNLLQELWSALAAVSASTIPSVTPPTVKELTAPYRDVMESTLEDWCSERLHTRRREKPKALFNLAPDQKDMDQLLSTVEPLMGLPEITEVVIEWIKGRLREQVAEARPHFVQEVTEQLGRRFEEIRARQIASGEWREQDVVKVHSNVFDALSRRVEDLQAWFDGVDTVATTSISLADLSLATETLFDQMIDGKGLRAKPDTAAEHVWFSPNEVKIAFDMLREIYFNALKRGQGPIVRLNVRRLAGADTRYAFSNRVDPTHSKPDRVETFNGSRYTGREDALFREGNSGRPKVAASAATLMGHDTAICSIVRRGVHHLVVPVRKATGCQP